MSIPPSWKDLSKVTNDLLGKDYPLGSSTLDVKTVAPNGVTFHVQGSQLNGKNDLFGDFEVKVANKPRGLTASTVVTSANQVRQTLEAENYLAKGFKLDYVGTFNPEKGTKTGVINTTFKQSRLHTRTLVDLSKGPFIAHDSVAGRDGFLAGYSAVVNAQTKELTNYEVGMGFYAPEYSITLQSTKKLTNYVASYYHRINADVETGARIHYDASKAAPTTKLELGSKVYLDNAAFIKAKINNDGILGLGYTQALRPGVKTSLGLALDTKAFAATETATPSHKFGAALFFEL